MQIEAQTDMLLFRYKSYAKTDFINEHISILKDNGYVWMLKVGKRTSLDRINHILKAGGWMILRSPKVDGSKFYLAKFTEMSEDEPEDNVYPEYYQEILDDDDNLVFETLNYQWFKITMLIELDEVYSKTLCMSNTNKKVIDVIDTTRTAVMFIRNESAITYEEAR